VCGLIGGSRSLKFDLTSLTHRGPDAASQTSQGPWTLGHTRLAIQDLSSASEQPVRASNCVVTYNGELWNPASLRSELEGFFSTSGDTEVVVRALDTLGVSALQKLNGMFALAWVDERDVLRLARDPYGEIPLHYGYTSGGEFVYCSEIAPMLQMGVASSTILWVPPGSVVTVEPGQAPVIQRWYETPEDQPDANVRDLLRQGVKNRQISDVPVAFLLSGGLDSSAVAALSDIPNAIGYTAVHHTKSRDRRLAQQIAARLGMTLIEVPVPVPTTDDLKRVVGIIEQPHKAQVEISWACMHLGQRLRSDGIKVILSGEGSDELLGSYGMAYHGIQKLGWREYREQTFVGQHRKNFARTNKVFMRYGIEARLPFLHPPLVSHLLHRTQEEVTRNKRHSKAILSEAVEHLVGNEIAWRPKAAFQTEAKLDRSVKSVVADPKQFYRDTYLEQFQGVKP
jgi:asparagine synthase (glutamine-hydrolysing)